jgi:hypothetical protein
MGYAQVVREDPVVRNLLFVGTELGIFASWDGGQRWASLRNNLPPVSVRDIKVHPRDHDLIVGTHGRGVFILDDITALRQVAQAMQADAYLFDVRPATRWMVWGRDASLGAKTFAAENPPYGALITYYVKTDPKDPVVITISERGGRPIRELRRTDVKAGVNRLAWDLRYDGPRPAQSQGQQAGGGGGGGGGGFGGGGVTVVPGEYTVTLRAAGRDLTKSVRVAADPRVQVAQADYEAQLAAALELRDLVSQVNQVIDRTEDLKKQLTGLIENLGKTTMAAADGGNGSNGSPRADTALVAATRAALQRVTDLRARLTRPIQGLGYRQYPRLREELTSLMGAVARPLARPTDAQMLRLGELKTETAQVVGEANAIVTDVIPELNRRLGETPHIVPGAAVR